MDIIFLGYSSIVERKVLPAAEKATNINSISIASSKPLISSEIPSNKIYKLYDDYEKAINESDSSLVYISFPNAMHAPWAERALLAGHHVIVDKPAFLSYNDARKLTRMANERKLLLAEANVWTYHTLFRKLKEYLHKRTIRSIYANFSSPPLDKHNFRYNSDMGAGILYDRMSYAISCARELLNSNPDEIMSAQRFSRKLKNVDLDISILMNFSNECTFMGFFSLECEYTNYIEIIGEDFRASANRVFTPPPNDDMEIIIQQKNAASTINIDACDTFRNFLEDVVDSLQNGNRKVFSDRLLRDAELLEDILEISRKKTV